MSSPSQSGQNPEIAARIASITAIVAADIPMDADAMRKGKKQWGIQWHRGIAVAVCLALPGIDREDLAQRFKVEPTDLNTMRWRAFRQVSEDADPEFQAKVRRLCQRLRIELVRGGDVTEVGEDWRAVDEVFATVAGFATEHFSRFSKAVYTGPQLKEVLPGKASTLRNWSWLAADICQRMPGMKKTSLAAYLKIRSQNLVTIRTSMPRLLARRPELKECNEAVSQNLGIPTSSEPSSRRRRPQYEVRFLGPELRVKGATPYFFV